MHKQFSKYEIYGFWGILRMIIFFFRTKIFFSKARLVRFPIEIRGKFFIDFGTKLTTGTGCRIEAFPLFSRRKIITFGDNVEINDYVHIAGISSVIIGNNVLVASKVYISDIQHGCYNDKDVIQSSPDIKPNDRPLSAKPIKIEDNVWIGESVSVMPGVTIGKGTIIGANSVVSKSLPPYVIAVGTPAKPIKQYNFEKQKWIRI